MREQLNFNCPTHGHDCPEKILKWSKVYQFTEKHSYDYEVSLIAESAEYTCNYCPSCGTKIIQ